MSFEAFMQIVSWIIIGGIAGYISSVVLKARTGCLIKIVIGIAGAFIGGFLMNFLMPGGLIPGWGFVNQIITATLGAIVLLIILEIILPGQQLGVSDEGGRRRR